MTYLSPLKDIPGKISRGEALSFHQCPRNRLPQNGGFYIPGHYRKRSGGPEILRRFLLVTLGNREEVQRGQTLADDGPAYLAGADWDSLGPKNVCQSGKSLPRFSRQGDFLASGVFLKSRSTTGRAEVFKKVLPQGKQGNWAGRSYGFGGNHFCPQKFSQGFGVDSFQGLPGLFDSGKRLA